MIAAACAGPDLAILPLTVAFGVPLITNAADITVARDAVVTLAPSIPEGAAGVIVSAFGDPGLAELGRLRPMPVAGICEAGLLEGAEAGARFAVVTTTPDLVAAIDAKALALGLTKSYVGVELTPGDPAALTAESDRLLAALSAAVERAIRVRGAEAVVIGGGPLATSARALARRFAVPIIEPIPAAMRQVLRAAAVVRPGP